MGDMKPYEGHNQPRNWLNALQGSNEHTFVDNSQLADSITEKRYK